MTEVKNDKRSKDEGEINCPDGRLIDVGTI